MSARHERHECDTSVTRVQLEQHQCDTSEKILILITAQVKIYFHIPRKGVLPLEMPHSYTKMRLKSAPQKLDFVIVKTISKSYRLDCSCKFPCTFPHSYAW